jgi:hypothetical protein
MATNQQACRWDRRVATIVLIMLAGASFALADAPQSGVVTGRVVGPEGDPIPGATVQITSEQLTMAQVADENAAFMFVFLAPGLYTVRADMPGFQPAAGQIAVSAGGRAHVELRLTEAIADEIVVTGESPLVNRYDMTGGGTVDAQELKAITGAARMYRSRLLFLPDVTNEVGSDRYLGNNPTIAGVPGSSNHYSVDGVDVTIARAGGGSSLGLPAAAVAEMKMQSSGADAEFSRSVGAYTTTILRSGTNSFHGSLQWKGENLAWNAENKIASVERLDQTVSAFDATAGGPIARDKLWFFLTYRYDETPSWDIMADGESVVNVGYEGQTRLLKLDWRPNASHSLAAMYADTPFKFPWWGRNVDGDLETVAWFNAGGDLATLRWSWAISDNLLLTTHAATTQADEDREAFVQSNVEPGCGPYDPCGNNWNYRPLRSAVVGEPAIRYNGIGLYLGEGYTAYPRDQLNASLEWLTGEHDIKLGIDYQKVAWDTAGVSVPFCRGYGFDEHAPGGFQYNASPTAAYRGSCRFYPTRETWQQGWGPTEHGSENSAVFVRDRFTVKNWTFNFGVRVDNQVHGNDIGETVIDSTDWAPRVAASYDMFGDSRLIVNASAGRYYQMMNLNWTSIFNIMPQGRSQYEQHRWNPTTQAYDDLIRVVSPETGLEITEVDPYHKDEVALGAEWQFDRNWTLELRAHFFEAKNFPDVVEQMDPVTGLYNEITNSPGRAERRAFTIAVQRRFSKSWMVAASYTRSRTMGNCLFSGMGCTTNFDELRIWTLPDGTPVSHHNEWGRSPTDRPNIVKVRGAYRLPLGKGHSLNIGGLFYLNSGMPWALIDQSVGEGGVVTIPPELDPLGQEPTHTIFEEPRGQFRLPDRKQLDLNVEWAFPISGRFSGYLRTEILNVTNEQELLAIAGLPQGGDPVPTTDNYQYPRTVRALVGFSF